MPAELAAVTPYGPLAGSSRVRVFDWLARIPAIPATVYPYIGAGAANPGVLITKIAKVVSAERALRELATSCPARLLLHREASPFSRGELERRLAKAAGMAVYDFDDALQWDVPRSIPTRLFPKPAKCIAAVRAADRVIAGNDTLADWAAGYARDVLVIPSCIEPSAYPPKTDYILGDPPRLIWLGSPSTERYLLSIAQTLLRLHERFRIRLIVISGPMGQLPGLDHLVDRIPWKSSGFGLEMLRGDIALAPLVDTPYARGKCAYKILQYAAAGLPFVASPVGASELATRRLGGLPATSPDEWYDAIAFLLTLSATTRQDLGQRARVAVEGHYSFGAWHSTWTEAVLGTQDYGRTACLGPDLT